jgi:micrococcal nuclease
MKLIVFAVYLWLYLSCEVQAKTLQGVVTHVSDGDTLWLRTSAQSKPIKVRLQGIDAPEACQAWGPEAGAALRKKLLNQSVSLNTRAKDDYDRALGRLQHQGEDVGQWLVSQGHAWSYHYRRDPGPYATEQSAAQKSRLGLWSQPKPEEPRAFRKRHGPCKI